MSARAGGWTPGGQIGTMGMIRPVATRGSRPDRPIGLAMDTTMQTVPPLRVAFGAVFSRIFLLTFLIVEVTACVRVRRWNLELWRDRKGLVILYYTPSSLFTAFLVAGLATVAIDLIVRLIARPIAARWYAPAGTGIEETPLSFHLGPRERVIAELPARRRSGRGWRAGTLVITDGLLRFYPVSWDLEPFEVGLDLVASVNRVAYRPRFGTFVLGVPDRIDLRTRDGGTASFAVVDPGNFLESLRTADLGDSSVVASDGEEWADA